VQFPANFAFGPEIKGGQEYPSRKLVVDYHRKGSADMGSPAQKFGLSRSSCRMPQEAPGQLFVGSVLFIK
jgi:hypothetical protein